MHEPAITITDVRIRRARTAGASPIAWASFVIDGTIRVSNVAIFQDGDGGYRTEFPSRVGRHGQRYHHVRPIDQRTRSRIDEAILSELGC